MSRDWRSVAARASFPGAVVIEGLLYAAYQGSDARFHWFTHFFVGASFALVVMSLAAWRTRRPVRAPLAWIVAAHVYAMFPDFLFDAGIAHRRWMDVFLAHISSHFLPGQNFTWYAVFIASAGIYLAVLDGLRTRADTAGWPLVITKSGSGTPVVFLHGLGASGRYWERLIGECQRSGVAMQALRIDLLGFGASPKPADATYDVACHVESLLPHVPLGSVLVGHSAGAILAGALAARHPDRITGMLLLGAPTFPDEDTARREVSRLGLLARLTVQHPIAGGAACGTMCALRPLLVPIAPMLAGDIPAEVAADFLHHTWASYRRTLRHVVVEHRMVPDLVAACRPVTFVAGAADRDAPVAWIAGVVDDLRAQGLPASLVEIDGGHHMALHDPAAVALALTGLLGDLAVPCQ